MRKKLAVWLLLILIGFVLGQIVQIEIPEKIKISPKGKIEKQKVAQQKQSEQQLILEQPRIKKEISDSFQDAIADAAEIAAPAVVNIDTVFMRKNPFSEFFEGDEFFRRFFGDSFPSDPIPEKGKGSGFIITKDGYVITNEHVVAGAKEIKVSLSDGRTFTGEIVGSDKMLDIALIKINSDKLPVAILGDSDKVRLGEWVVAIGNPFGFQQTITSGIVSAKGRTIREPEQGKILENLIQTDAAINRGNSGGPLINLRGEVIGINTAIFSPSGGNIGIGFAIPINSVKDILDDLKKHGKVSRPWIGISLQEITPEIAEYFELKDTNGALIADVAANSPGEKAGLRRKDIILEINQIKVKKPQDVVKEVRRNKIGNTLMLLILRNKQRLYVPVKLGKMP